LLEAVLSAYYCEACAAGCLSTEELRTRQAAEAHGSQQMQ